jgi:hypothetical protein
MNPRVWSALMLVLPLAAGCSSERKPCKIVFPDGFEGGAAIVWDVGRAAALPADGGLLLIEVSKEGIAETSSHFQAGNVMKDEFYWRKGATLVPIPEAQRIDRTTGSHRSCGAVEQIFIGDKAKLGDMKTALDARLDAICSGSGENAAVPQGWTIPLVEPGVGIGPVHLGMTRADLNKIGLPIKEGQLLEVGSYRVEVEADHVVAIEVSLASQPQGVKIGSEVIAPGEKDLMRIVKGLPDCGKVDVKIGASEVACAGGTTQVKAGGPSLVVTIGVMTKERAAKVVAPQAP